jgi:N-acetylneuraminic acid mutarotase
MVVLPNGKVLATGGSSNANDASATSYASSELFDPATNTWSATGSMHVTRTSFGQIVLLKLGKVLIVGGSDSNINSVDYASAELYNPTAGTWNVTGSLNTARRNPAIVELQNGRVLAIDGARGAPTCSRYLSSTEIYDPTTGQWSSTGSTHMALDTPQAVTLRDGRVLLFTGAGTCDDLTTTTELYDPNTGQWSYSGNLAGPGRYDAAFVLLPDGRVLLAGGTAKDRFCRTPCYTIPQPVHGPRLDP